MDHTCDRCRTVIVQKRGRPARWCKDCRPLVRRAYYRNRALAATDQDQALRRALTTFGGELKDPKMRLALKDIADAADRNARALRDRSVTNIDVNRARRERRAAKALSDLIRAADSALRVVANNPRVASPRPGKTS